jgi:hypothetical protein
MQKNDAIALDTLAAKPIDGLSNDEVLEHIALLIDGAADHGSTVGTARAFELLDEFRARTLSAVQQASAHYFSANAWQNKRLERARADWSWEQPEAQAQILQLRKAVQHEGFKELPTALRCRVLTNLANQFSFIGRSIEAAETWDRALAEDGKFGMALGNLGVGLNTYAQHVHDGGQASAISAAAHTLLTRALAPTARFDVGDERARDYFDQYRRYIEQHVDVAAVHATLSKRRYGVGKTKREQSYRNWCLTHRLFLNPLNDIGAVAIASRDSLTLPSLTTAVDAEMPWVFGFFNQLKQEFASARFMFFEGLQSDKTHFSDHGVKLANTLDYPSYSLNVEKQRAAFRVAYSILDKVGYFINDYFGAGHRPDRVFFKTVWLEPKGSDPKPVQQRFASSKNWMLRGLFWLSKDLFNEELKASTEPDARALDIIRQHLEHKYVQVHESWTFDPLQMTEGLRQHRYSISRDDFSLKTLKLLKLARAALIYLPLAIQHEERQRPESEGIIAPMPISDWSDSWKR